MKTFDPKMLLIGLVAGITAALLVFGAGAQPSFAAVLYAASALPILLAGLGWGNLCVVIAIATAAAIGAVFVSPSFAVVMTAVTLAPAGWISHLANLGRPASEIGGPSHLMAWYPLSDIMLQLCALVAVGVIIVGFMVGYGPHLTDQLVDLMMEQMQAQQPELASSAEVVAQTKRLVVLVLPMTQGGLWVLFLFSAYYVATRIVAASGRGLRPREDMPSSLRMNRYAIFAFLAGLAACFVGGLPALIGATVVGTFGAGFLISGFAVLHFRTRGKPWRMPALILAYLASTMLLPAFLIVVLGLADTRRAISLTPGRNPQSSNSTET